MKLSRMWLSPVSAKSQRVADLKKTSQSTLIKSRVEKW